MTQPPAHSARRCDLCRPLRHPSYRDTRRALDAGLPRQTRRPTSTERTGQ